MALGVSEDGNAVLWVNWRIMILGRLDNGPLISHRKVIDVVVCHLLPTGGVDV